MEIISYIAFALIILVLGALAVDSTINRIKNKELSKKALQLEIDKAIISDKLNKVILEHSAEKTDGFLRFVSESREQAFKYIEDVQEAIKVFDEELGPLVKHYKETGKPISRKQSETLVKVVEAYDIIMTLMPEESNET